MGSAMGAEANFVESLRAIVGHAGARGLEDDVAVLEMGGTKLVLTHDSLVEGVHFLPDDPPESVAWKLVAVNLSDLAAKGARPLAVLMGYTLRDDPVWDQRFVLGLHEACDVMGVPLLGGDTVSAPHRVLGLTAIGETAGPVPSRKGAGEGDAIFVTGSIGDAGAGLALARDGATDPEELLAAYREPQPQLEAGQALAPVVTAMMDVSDGLLLDLQRLAAASGVGAVIDLDAVPLSTHFRQQRGASREARLFAATSGDDYQLLFTSAMPLPSLPCPVARIGQLVRGAGVQIHDAKGSIPLPQRLGWQHD